MNCWANCDIVTSNEGGSAMDIGTILIATGMILYELLDDDEDS